MIGKTGKYYLYYIINLLNSKIYLGVTSNPKSRWRTHQLIARCGKKKFPKHFQAIHQAIRKYGVENFSFELMEEFESEDACYLSEMFYIYYFKTIKKRIYNLSGGGKGTGSNEFHPLYKTKLSPDRIKQMKKNLAERYIKYPELRGRYRRIMLKRNWVGKNHPMYGKKHSKVTRILISKKGKGRIVSKETRLRQSKSLKGRIVSISTRKKLRLMMKKKNWIGRRNPNFGNKWSFKQRRNLSRKKKGQPNNHQRMFSEKQVYKILDLKFKKNIATIKISEKFKCAPSTIKFILSGKQYNNYYKKYISLN